MRRIFLTGCASLALATSAFAADLDAYPDYVEPVATDNSAWAAYFDIHGGWGTGEESLDDMSIINLDSDADWDELVLGGAARGTFFLGQAFSLQLDAWINHSETDVDMTLGGNDISYDLEGYEAGLAAHLTYRAPTDTQFGALASVGEVENFGRLFNIGAEAVQDIGNLRLYGQAGYVEGFEGYADDMSQHLWYVHGVMTYYITPNLSVSGNLGYSESNTSPAPFEVDESELTWGASLEVKPGTMPFSAYASYQGNKGDGDSSVANWDGEEHLFLVGLRFLLNRDTLREIDSATGLIDLNPLYGDMVN